MSGLTLEMVRHMAKWAQDHAEKPKRVLTEEQAIRMTQEDRLGFVWRVGDEYYELQYQTSK